MAQPNTKNLSTDIIAVIVLTKILSFALKMLGFDLWTKRATDANATTRSHQMARRRGGIAGARTANDAVAGFG